jgi:hypothetical protein
MPARYVEEHCTIHWTGVDDDTPEGCVTAIGTDAFNVVWLWLFRGDTPTEKSFLGSISIPEPWSGRQAMAYNQGGGFAFVSTDTRESLEKLTNLATS